MSASQKIAACVHSPRLVWKVLALILLLFVLTLLSGYTANFYAHQKAEKLLLQIRTLEAGRTTVDEANRIVQRFGGEEYDARSYYGFEGSNVKYVSPDPCLGDDLSYAINVRPPKAFLWALAKIPALQHLGWHSWYVVLMIHHKNGKLTCYSQIVAFARPDGQEVGAEADLEQRNPRVLLKSSHMKLCLLLAVITTTKRVSAFCLKRRINKRIGHSGWTSRAPSVFTVVLTHVK